jgi:methyltransferase
VVAPYLAFLLVLALERLFELYLSRRNARWAFAHGGVEFGQGHFAAMKVLHTTFLISCALEVTLLERPFWPRLGIPMFVLAILAQVLRYWAIATLGKRWNVRVIVVPGLPAVDKGPYRFLRHPNYLAVILEGFAVPLVHSAFWTAIGFSFLNAYLLRGRIRCEEEALAEHAEYWARLGDRHRFLPTAGHGP